MDARCTHGAHGPGDCPLCRARRSEPIRAGAALARIGLPDGPEPGDYAGRDRITYTSHLQAQFSLPYADPGPATEWRSTSGPHTLILSASPSHRPDGSVTAALPYGNTPRLLLMWLTTQAVLTGSPTIELGDSLRSFVAQVGVPTANAAQRRNLLDQLARVVALRYTMATETHTDANGYRGVLYRSVADEAHVWFSRGDASSDATLLTSQVTLSDRYFEEFVSRAIPLSTQHLVALQRKGAQGLTLDIYAWLAYRTHGLSDPFTVPWASIATQFGAASYARQRDFRSRFREALGKVLAVHDGFRVQANESGLLLLPGKSPIASRPRRRTLASRPATAAGNGV